MSAVPRAVLGNQNLCAPRAHGPGRSISFSHWMEGAFSILSLCQLIIWEREREREREREGEREKEREGEGKRERERERERGRGGLKGGIKAGIKRI